MQVHRGAVLIALALFTAGCLACVREARKPAGTFLAAYAGAEWIEASRPTELGERNGFDIVVCTRRFTLREPATNVTLAIDAANDFELVLDGTTVPPLPGAASSSPLWASRRVELPPLAAGPHELKITVINGYGEAALRVRAGVTELNTGEGWSAAVLDGEEAPAAQVIRRQFEDHGNARWIGRAGPRRQVFPGTEEVVFRTIFELKEPSPASALRVRADGRVHAWLDRSPLAAPTVGDRFVERLVGLPELAAGRHELRGRVRFAEGPTLLWAKAETLGLRSDPTWTWAPAHTASWGTTRLATGRAPVADAARGPTARDALVRLAPWLAAVALATIGLLHLRERSERVRSLCSPSAVEAACVVGWLALAAHNFSSLPPIFGFDVPAHLEYIRYLDQFRSLPRADEGWQMFQPPLYHSLSWLLFGSPDAGPSEDAYLRLLRLLSVACGIGQILLTGASARLLFPERPGLRVVAVLVAGALPVSLYMSQYAGNEPLAGVLSAATLMCLLRVLVQPGAETAPRWLLVTAGSVWGLALLTKVTPVLLAPGVAWVAWAASARGADRSRLRAAFRTLAWISIPALIVAGWHYANTWSHFGTPFVGGWEKARGLVWWQHPGYRTLEQFTAFGEALDRPVLAATGGFWDALHASLWSDGLLGGLVDARGTPWKLDPLAAGALLGLIPAGLALAGAFLGRSREEPLPESVRLFFVISVGVHLAAVALLYLRVPSYSGAKASYLLGLIPVMALLVAAGTAVLGRNPLAARGLGASLVCWAAAAACAYWAN